MRWLGVYGPLLGLVTALAAIASMYVVLGERPPESVDAIFRLAPALFLVYWVVIDARRLRRVPCHDFGFLVGLFLPVSLPWYLVWSRGLRGLFLLGFFLFLLTLPTFTAAIVRQLMSGQLP